MLDRWAVLHYGFTPQENVLAEHIYVFLRECTLQHIKLVLTFHMTFKRTVVTRATVCKTVNYCQCRELYKVSPDAESYVRSNKRCQQWRDQIHSMVIKYGDPTDVLHIASCFLDNAVLLLVVTCINNYTADVRHYQIKKLSCYSTLCLKKIGQLLHSGSILTNVSTEDNLCSDLTVPDIQSSTIASPNKLWY